MELVEISRYKEIITDKLNDTVNNFVAIGFYLRKIRESGELEGCSDIYEFANKNWKISRSTASRFMAINEKYSIDGYSEKLRPEFLDYKYSQLQEMLTLPEKELEVISPSSTVSDIRAVKEYAKEEEERKDGIQQTLFQKPEKATTLADAVMDFLKGKDKALNDLMIALQMPNEEDRAAAMKEIFAPSGYGTHRSGLILMIYSEQGVEVRKFGTATKKMSWREFAGEISQLRGILESGESQEAETGQQEEETKCPSAGEISQLRDILESGEAQETETGQQEEEAKCHSAGEISQPEGILEDRETQETETGQQEEENRINTTAESTCAMSQLPRVEGEVIPEEKIPYQKPQIADRLEGLNDSEIESNDIAVDTQEEIGGGGEGTDGKKESFIEITKADRASYVDALQHIWLDSAYFLEGRNLDLELMKRHTAKLTQMQEKLWRMMRDWGATHGD